MAKLRDAFPRPPLIWAEVAYASQLVEWAAAFSGSVLEIGNRTDDVKGIELLPHRCVAERKLGSLGRHCKDCEYLTASSGAMLKISIIDKCCNG